MRLCRDCILRPMVLGFSAILWVGCGPADNSGLLAEEEDDVKPLIVLMGGNQTCGEDSRGRSYSPYINGVFQGFVRNILGGDYESKEWRYIASCYDTSSDTNVYFAKDNNTNDIRSATKELFATHVDRYIEKAEKVVLVGHSYGGWLAMNVALQLSETRNGEKLAGLYTIDPISRVHCTFTRPAGCTQAPQDFNADMKNRIRSVVGVWKNYYQEETFYLHSSSIAEADQNYVVNVSHSQIDDSDEVWANVERP